MKTVNLVYFDPEGRPFIDPEIRALGRSGRQFWELGAEEMIPLPPGTDLMYLPERPAIGLDPASGETVTLYDEEDNPLVAVAAILPAGYTRLYLPPYEYEGAKYLPLFGYTAVAAVDGELCVAAVQTDLPHKWNPLNYNDRQLPLQVRKKLREFPGNRILGQLAHCSLDYHCLTAQNMFYERWEAGIPTSPACNARCLGCISLQEAECCPSPQERIDFVPTVEEIVSIGASHLENAPEAIISFGQGCEGEPLLQADLLVEAVRRIRERTDSGTININTNAGDWKAVARLSKAGLNSIRVSLISAREETYRLYHRPRGYGLGDVRRSLRVARENGVFTSLNLLVFPGLTDSPGEMEALFDLLAEGTVNLVQLRNLNIDPDLLTSVVPFPEEDPVGILRFLAILKERFPAVQVGNFSKPLRTSGNR